MEYLGMNVLACDPVTGLVLSCVEAEMIAGALNYICDYHSSLSLILTWIFLVALVSLKTAYCWFLECNLLYETKVFLLINWKEPINFYSCNSFLILASVVLNSQCSICPHCLYMTSFCLKAFVSEDSALIISGDKHLGWKNWICFKYNFLVLHVWGSSPAPWPHIQREGKKKKVKTRSHLV